MVKRSTWSDGEAKTGRGEDGLAPGRRPLEVKRLNTRTRKGLGDCLFVQMDGGCEKVIRKERPLRRRAKSMETEKGET